LRGSGRRGSRRSPVPPISPIPPPAQPPIIIHPQPMDKEFSFEALPNVTSAYPAWRFGMRVVMLGKYSLRSREIKKFLADTEIQGIDHWASYTMYDFEEQVEGKLYAALIGACKSKEHSELKLEIESDCHFGRGRQVLKHLDEEFEYEGDKLATENARSVVRSRCENIQNLGAFVKQFKYAVFVLKTFDSSFGEAMMLAILKSAVEHLKELEATLEAFDLQAKPLKTTKALLKRLGEKASDLKKKS
jgi:hypothetical protein